MVLHAFTHPLPTARVLGEMPTDATIEALYQDARQHHRQHGPSNGAPPLAGKTYTIKPGNGNSNPDQTHLMSYNPKMMCANRVLVPQVGYEYNTDDEACTTPTRSRHYFVNLATHLARWRAHGEGPTWFKQGRNVYYPTREN